MDKNNISPWALFEDSYRKYPQNLMIIHNNKKCTYTDIYDKVLEFSQSISKWEFTIGGLYLPNCTDFIIGLLALNRQKKVLVPLSYQLKGESLSERINYSDIELIVTDKNGFKELCNIKSKLQIKSILIVSDNMVIETHEFNNIKKNLNEIKDNTFGICFTGGSTSKPKGVVLSNYAVSGNALAVAEVLAFKSEDIFLMARPLTQAGPIASDLLMAISSGAGIVILNDLYHPAVFLKAIEDHKPTTTYMVRTMLAQILDYPRIDRFEISSLKRIILGAMITPESVFKKALKQFPGVSLYNAYGLSEAAVRVSFAYHDDIQKHPGTVGRPIRGCSMEVYRDDGTVADTGEEGEIFVKTAYTMDGYYKYKKLTEETLTDRGLRTRDKGYRNEQGMFFIAGRTDDLIVQGGNNVYPIEIEEVLLMYPNVSEAVVLGIDDEKLGQRIVALVKTTKGTEVLLQDLYKFCRSNLEDRKIPREIYLVDNIMKNEMGKINRNELKILYNSLKPGRN